MSFKGKVIYNPSGKASEYSQWAANFYNGCSVDCSYCYMKKEPMARFWSTTPYLKKQLKDRKTAIEIFVKELLKNLGALQKNGLFFSFTSDPMLLEYSYVLNRTAIDICLMNNVPVKILTKQVDWVFGLGVPFNKRSLLNIGFTLTGCDEYEKGAPTNLERIAAMKILKERGYKTWASIEPVIDIEKSYIMIVKAIDYCDHFKTGLLSGIKFNKGDLGHFLTAVNHLTSKFKKTVYWKDDLLKQAGIDRKDLPRNCVARDYF